SAQRIMGDMFDYAANTYEMDLMQFVSAMNRKWKEYYVETNLQRIREYAGLSRRELADLSEISLRQIQLFEQRQRDINHTRAINLVKLSRALRCRCEDLLEL
ncbi:MAG: helix-turn-helix transcriptional regulator, partial [Lachnospiraceae bacterium]|nr:helix-turn-helix transcriptional regulator [Lachnospiraceae bacterium]